MGQNKEQLNKLLAFIDELAKDKDNAWFVEELYRKYGRIGDARIEEIYEYCIEKIIFEQATQFYKDFPIKELLNELITDYRRMERYRRQNNFGDFCLAVFQQVENVTNWFCQRPKFIELYTEKKKENSVFTDASKIPIPIGKLIVRSDYEKRKDLELKDLYFNERLRAILYFVYCDEKASKYVFDNKYKELNELYQCRNLNHRGGEQNPYQKEIIGRIKPHKYIYYLKFTGLLVDYIDHISRFMSKKEEKGIVTNVLPDAVYIKSETGENIMIDRGELWYKVKAFKIGDKVVIESNRVTKEILNVKITNRL